MKILIIEDEKPIAKYIDRLSRKILKDDIENIKIVFSLEDAISFISHNQIDLCLLDLNLNGDDGYQLLKTAAKDSFQTIIISANTDRAIEAFEYEVLDFIAKPFDEERLHNAFEKFFNLPEKQNSSIQHLSIRKDNRNVVIQVDEISCFKSAGIYVEVHLKKKQKELLDKTMDQLEQILPANFLRVHRSVIVDLSQIQSYSHSGGGIYQIVLKTGELLPLSRQKYKELQKRLNH